MRSTRPKPLHLLCGRPMVLHVLDALSGCDIDRTVVVVGHGAERVTKKVQEHGRRRCASSFVEQVVQRGTGDAVMRRHDRVPRRRPRRRSATCSCCPATRRCCGPRPSPRLVRQHRADRRRGDAAHRACSTTRPATAGSSASKRRPRRTGRRAARRHRRGAGDRRDQHVDLLLPPRPARRRRCAGSAPTTPRASTTSPTSSRCSPTRATRSAPSSIADAGRDPGRQRPGAAGRSPRPSCGAAPTGAGCSTGVTMLDPRQTYIDVTVAARARRHALPGHDPAGHARSSATAARSGRTPGSSTAWSAPARSWRTPSAATPRSATTPWSVRSPCSSPAAAVPVRNSHRARSTLLLGATKPDPGYVGGRRIDGARHQEAARPLLRARPPGAGRGDRRAPRRRARRPQPGRVRQRRDATAGSPRASAAPTCSSCRRHYGCDGRVASTTRSWSS